MFTADDALDADPDPLLGPTLDDEAVEGGRRTRRRRDADGDVTAAASRPRGRRHAPGEIDRDEHDEELVEPDDDVAPRIRAALEHAGRKLLAFDDVVRRGHFTSRDRPAVARALRDLLRRGVVVEARRDRYALAARQHLVAGRISIHPDGFAFVTTEPGDAPAAPEGDDDAGGRRAHRRGRREHGRRGRGRGDDVKPRGAAGGPSTPATRRDLYVRGSNVRPAMHGDRVLASVMRRGRERDERLEGKVVQVLERRTTRVVGVYRRGRTGAIVIPQDHRLPYRVHLVDGGADGEALREPSRRESAAASRPGVNDGDMIVTEIVRYPDEHSDIEARLVAVLGPANDPRVETDAVIHEH